VLKLCPIPTTIAEEDAF